MPSLTPMSDAMEAGLRKMIADLEASMGRPDNNDLAARITLAAMPAFIRAYAKEIDHGADAGSLLHAIEQSFANIITSAILTTLSGSSAGPIETADVAIIFLQNLAAGVISRLNIDALPDGSKLSVDIEDTPVGRA